MNTITDRFDQIISFAQEYGLPQQKKRAIVREYIQVKVLDYLYRTDLFNSIYFVGGTSLRLLRGIDRFSEDLDFDIHKKNIEVMESAMNGLVNYLKKESILV